ncbi:hypothetical protein Ga0123461_0653 [Mariprofundus aestuarium]|uniref:Transporter suffix domain-containing protein n=1 Tax=Mariprofundus aestuarium TaxID=1921086 RepID=A0A2K8KYV4_MARES|nr:transporter suffix domain-containing protein [Mariprofundus aestuarium]ATX79079.1 hypothetical protein Ga0123461_0653 [Mariprofundus aestuarium]
MSERLSLTKRSLGLLLFWSSWLLWGVVLIVPFMLDSDAATIAVIVTSLLVAAEVCFAASLLLLGRPFCHAVKAKLKPLWQRISDNNASG